MTDDQLHRILTGQDKRCSDKVCRKICRAEDTKLGLCMSCWNAYSDLVRTEKDKLQDKVTRIASKLVSNLAETCSVRRCAQKLLEGPRVFEKGVRAREINPRAVKRVLAFGYQFGLSTGDCEMVEDIHAIKNSLYY